MSRVIPTFLLNRIDPNKILADYQAGVFSRPPQPKAKITVSQHTTILAPTYGSTNESAIYSVRDRNNNSVIVATTYHNNYEVYTKTNGDLPAGGRCDTCKKDFDTIAVGYPVAYQELTVLTSEDGDPNNAVYRVVYIFWVEGEFCTFQCAMHYIKTLLRLPADQRSSGCNDSERMLNMLFRLTYPNAPPLCKSQDPRLLQSNKGSLSDDQWKDQRHTYIKTDRVLMVPIKTEYLQQNFNVPVIAIESTKEDPTTIAVS